MYDSYASMAGYGYPPNVLSPAPNGMLINEGILSAEGITPDSWMSIGNPAAAATNPAIAPNWLSKDSILGFTDANGVEHGGWGMPVLGALRGLGSAWMGMKQYGLAKDQLKESQRQFDKNFEAQRQLTNSRLEDRQRARVASNPGAYRSVGEYMQEYGVKR